MHARTYMVHGHTLAALINRRGLTGSAVARASGVDRSLISRLCSGERKTVTYATARAISNALDVDMGIWVDPIPEVALDVPMRLIGRRIPRPRRTPRMGEHQRWS